MFININFKESKLIIDTINSNKINGKFIIILFGDESEQMKVYFSNHDCIVLNINKSVGLTQQINNKKYICDLIEFIEENLKCTPTVSLIVNTDVESFSSLVNCYAEYINNAVIISNNIFDKQVSNIPILNIFKETKNDSASIIYPCIYVKNDNLDEICKEIISWINKITLDENKLKFPVLKRINSEELSCKMIDLTSKEHNKNNSVKVKLI